jgi:hypothetical protein
MHILAAHGLAYDLDKAAFARGQDLDPLRHELAHFLNGLLDVSYKEMRYTLMLTLRFEDSSLAVVQQLS